MAITSVFPPTQLPSLRAPPSVVGPKTKCATRPTHQLPESLIKEAQSHERVPFDAKEHINYEAPDKIYTMKEIGLEGQGISPNAVSSPFRLFTQEAITQMRAEIFSQPILDNCQYASDFAKNIIRGYGPKLAPFIFDAWNRPEVLDSISKVAGIELVPAMDFEIGQTNISINDTTTEITTSDSSNVNKEEIAFSWHYDSYPFVCVVMLSDCTSMVGGETAICMGNGEVIKVRGPSTGTALVMQGRYIKHAALKATGGQERITMVTSFRPKNPLVRDETVLTGVRPVSTLPELYSQYTKYRLEVLQERVRIYEKEIWVRERAGQDFDIIATRDFVEEQRQFLDAMLLALIVQE